MHAQDRASSSSGWHRQITAAVAFLCGLVELGLAPVANASTTRR
jgi:hypothetical protein